MDSSITFKSILFSFKIFIQIFYIYEVKRRSENKLINSELNLYFAAEL